MSTVKIGDRVRMPWGQKGTIKATSGTDKTCLVQYDGDGQGVPIMSNWTDMDRLEVINPVLALLPATITYEEVENPLTAYIL